MKRVLTILEGAGKGNSKLLTSPLIIVGRSKDADFQINDPLVSRIHLEIRVEAGVVFVENKSTHGSLLNDKPLAGVVSLNPGDVVDIGNTKLRFEEAATIPFPSCSKEKAPDEALSSEIDGTRIAEPLAFRGPSRKEASPDETRALVEDGTRMLNPSELPNWVAQGKNEKTASAKGVSWTAMVLFGLLLALGAAYWIARAQSRATAESTMAYRDSLYQFSIVHPLDWSKTADDTGLIGFGFGREQDNIWGRVNIYTDKDAKYGLTGLTDGFDHYQDILKTRYQGFDLIGSKVMNVNHATVIFYGFDTPALQGKGIYTLNADARIVVECISPRACYQQYASEYSSILQSFELDEYGAQQFIDFPLPDEGMQQLALANPSELARQVDSHIQSGKILLDNRDVSPDNLFKSIREFRSALQLCLAPPQRLAAYDTAAGGLAEATRLFDEALKQQRFQITSALKEGDNNRAYWAANKLMQMVPDKTNPVYQEAYRVIKSLPPPERYQ